MDWKETLASLRASLPAGEETDGQGAGSASPDVPKGRKDTLHVIVERKGRAGKTATIIEGFTCPDSEVAEVAARLKRALGTGGSARGGEILIQGDVAAKVRRQLMTLGYKLKGI